MREQRRTGGCGIYAKLRKEADIKAAILEWLHLQPKTYPISIHTTGIPDGKGFFRKNKSAGTSDILGCKNGKFFALEVKREDGEATPKQRRFLEGIAAAGGYAAIVHNLGEAVDCWREI